MTLVDAPCLRRRAFAVLASVTLAGFVGGCAASGPEADGPAAPAEPAAALDASVMLLARCTEPGGPALDAGPWITNVTPTSATVVFQTGGDVDSSVRFLPSDGDCDEETLYSQGAKIAAPVFTQADVPYSKSGDLVPEHLHSATFTLPDAAAEDRRVCYGIELAPNEFKKENHYFCAPDLANGLAGTSFVMPGTSGDRFDFYVYGDVRNPSGYNKIHEEVADRMTAEIRDDLAGGEPAAQLVVNTGDFAYFGCDDSLWVSNFLAPARALLQQLPNFSSPGNHEGYDEEGGPACGSSSYYFAFFAEPYRAESSMAPGMYSFDHKNARFISLNIISNTDQGGLDPAAPGCQATPDCDAAELCPHDWLRCRLSGAGAEDWDAIDHVFVFQHAPLITAPPDGKHASSAFQIAHLAPLLEQPDGSGPGKVTALFSGHNHFYERSLPLTGLCAADDDACIERSGSACPEGPTPDGFQFPAVCYRQDPAAGVTYVISGGGGATPYTAPEGSFPIQWLAGASNAYHYLRISVDGSTATMTASGFHADGSSFTDSAVLRN